MKMLYVANMNQTVFLYSECDLKFQHFIIEQVNSDYSYTIQLC